VLGYGTIAVLSATALAITCAAVDTSPCSASDAFGNLSCGPAIEASLISRTMPPGSNSSMEFKFKSIGLRILGSTQLSEDLYSQSFIVCGREFMIIVNNKHRILDAISIPNHSREAPESIGRCEANGKTTKYEIVAVLDNSDPSQSMLPAKFARVIDLDRGHFQGVSLDNLKCSRDGIFTADGGK
jgi:hypothetical protein